MKNVPRILFFLICAYKNRFVFVSLRFFDWNFGIVPTVYVIYYIYSILTIFLSNIAGVTRGAGQLALSSLIPVAMGPVLLNLSFLCLFTVIIVFLCLFYLVWFFWPCNCCRMLFLSRLGFAAILMY